MIKRLRGEFRVYLFCLGVGVDFLYGLVEIVVVVEVFIRYVKCGTGRRGSIKLRFVGER